MISNLVLSVPQRVSSLRERKGAGALLDILFAFGPLLIVGTIGEWLGDGTALGAVLINLAYVLSVVLATAVLNWRGSGWRKIGLAKPDSWPKTVLLALGTVVAAIVARLALQAVIQILPGPEMAPADQSSFNPLAGNLPLLIIMVLAAWTTIAFGEEMMWRAFLMNRLVGFQQSTKLGWTLALLASSLAFGLAHFSWGFAGVVDTTVMGLVLGFVYLRTGRNLWVTIITHGMMNTLWFVLIFSGSA